MDDAAQSSGQSQDAQTNAPQQGAISQPVSLPHKEHAPAVGPVEYGAIQPSEVEPQIAPEVAEAGVEASPDPHTPAIHPVAKQAGMTHAKQHAPVSTTPGGRIQLPMTQVNAQQVKKTASVKDSIRWLAELVLEQFKRGETKSS